MALGGDRGRRLVRQGRLVRSDGRGRDVPELGRGEPGAPRDDLPAPPDLAASASAAASVSVADLAAVREQLQREPRGVVGVAHRCPCGLPDVVETAPRLPDGTPFPTTFYLTCPRATGAVSTLESTGLMKEMTDRLAADPELAAHYRAAHDDYLQRRAALGVVPEIAGISAGGMPTRVKCLHVLVGHALAAGPGVNPLGDEALALLPEWWASGPCVAPLSAAVARDARGESGETASLKDRP
jgi:hypothetical protein